MKRAPSPPQRSRRLVPALAIGLTLLLRLWFILEVRGTPFSTVSAQMVDAWYYHRWALEILGGSFWGSDVFFLRPLYPYFLAGVYAVFGRHVLPVQLVQAALAGVSCWLLYDIARRLFGPRPAAFAAFGYAICGVLVFYTGTLMYVELTVLFTLLTVWLLLAAGRRWWAWLLSGLAFGLSVICRPELLVLAPALALWFALRRVGRRNALIAAAGAFAVVGAVPLRNYIVARDPVVFTAHSGVNFYYGNNPSSDGAWQPAPELHPAAGFSHEMLKRTSRTVDGRQLSWSAASNYWLGRGLRFIVEQPGAWLRLELRKLLLFLSDYEVPSNYYLETARARSTALRVAFLSFGMILALAIPGLAWAWRERRTVLPAYLYVAAYLLSALMFYVLSRLRAPVIPFLLVFAGYGLHRLIDAFRARRPGRAWTGVATAAAVLAISLLIPVRRDAYSSQAHAQAANILLAGRELRPAIAELELALAADPGNISARYSLLVSLATAGRVGEAERHYRHLQEAAAASPVARPLARLGAARLAIARRDFATAARLYRESLAENPGDAETSYLLGLVYVSVDSLPAAREFLARAVSIDPHHTEARTTLAAVEARLR
ncbi:MAG: glycosyltransferase family 39 protein [bacterium]